MKRSESHKGEEGAILDSSDAIFVQLRSGFYIYAQETVGMVEMVLVAGDKNINSLCLIFF